MSDNPNVAVLREYAERDVLALRKHYVKHVAAMTAEGLHSKSDIAAELAWRDAEIERLTASLAALEAQASAPESGSWIAADDVKRLTRQIDVAFNGEEGAAKQAALCDIASQVCIIARRVGPILPAFAKLERERREQASAPGGEVTEPPSVIPCRCADATARRLCLDKHRCSVVEALAARTGKGESDAD